jgi:hypothetical protein
MGCVQIETVLRCTDTFGSDMGSLSDGTEVGDLLMRGSWNARPYGPLYDVQVEGVKNGTDFYFHKSKGAGMIWIGHG